MLYLAAFVGTLVGLLIGALVGIFVASLCVAAKNSTERECGADQRGAS